MLEAYLDESGVHDGAEICVIAGYFGKRKQFRKLERGWKRVLAHHNFPLERFDAAKIVKTRKYERMLIELAETIAGCHSVYPVSFGIVISDFNSFSLVQRRWLTGALLDDKTGKLVSSGSPNKPYFVPFQNCVRHITDYTPAIAKVHFFFGLDRPFSKYANIMFTGMQKRARQPDPHTTWKSKKRLGTVAFPLAAETPELQAADLIVHLTYQHMLERHAVNDWNVLPKGLLLQCLSNAKRPEDFQFLDKSCLSDYLRQSRDIAGNWDT